MSDVRELPILMNGCSVRGILAGVVCVSLLEVENALEHFAAKLSP